MPHLLLLALCLLVALPARRAAGQAVDPRQVRYQPPPVDYVYPPPPGEAEVEGEAGADAPDAEDVPPADDEADVVEEPAPGTESAPAAEPGGVEATAPAAEPATQPAAAPEPEEIPEYGARATLERTEPGSHEVTLEDARDLPGSFGDPLRVVELLPGTVPVSSGLPYFYSRGSPPANQGYRYDGVLLPQLFHVAIGPQVLHPRMVESIEYYGAVPPADFGRRAGALVDVHAPEHGYRLLGEVDLRLLDLNGFVETPVGQGNLQVAGRLGYPGGLLVRLFAPDATLAFWDGQLRYELPLSADDRLQVMWLGSFDDARNIPFTTGATETNSLALHFHRVVLRAIHDLEGGGELGASVRFGFDDSSLGTALFVRAFSFGPKLWLDKPFGDGHRLSAGLDMYGTAGQLRDEGGTIGGIDGQLPLELPGLAEASARNQGGVYSSVVWRTSDTTRVTTGARVDLWKVQTVLNVGVDPRLRVAWDATDTTVLHAAAGLAHQPAVFLLPLPGLSEVAVSDRLTRAYQFEIGAHQELPYGIDVQLTPFFSYQQNVLLPELVIDGEIEEDPPVVDAHSAGLEIYSEAKYRFPRGHTLQYSGSYTLGFAKALSPESLLGDFRPDFDVRHVLNFAGRYDHPSGFNIGLRIGTRSGRLIEQQNPSYTQRLPWFTRLDARIGYQWQGRWALMNAYVEMLNTTVAAEYLDADCFFGQCTVEQAPPIAAPNLGVRATFD